MFVSVEVLVGVCTFGGGAFYYFIRVESRLSKIATDICWIKKVLNSRHKIREDEGEPARATEGK